MLFMCLHFQGARKSYENHWQSCHINFKRRKLEHYLTVINIIQNLMFMMSWWDSISIYIKQEKTLQLMILFILLTNVEIKKYTNDNIKIHISLCNMFFYTRSLSLIMKWHVKVKIKSQDKIISSVACRKKNNS